jgi:hypothetical protein
MKKNNEVKTDEQSANELQRLTDENAELRKTLGLERAKWKITTELTAAGARSPELLFASVSNEIELDEQGEPANTAGLVASLRSKHPEQFGTQPSPIDAGAGAVTKPALTRESLRGMKPAEIAKLDWAAVREALSQNN